ncbi:E3 ubiquitin-protein ligase SDIR1-like [Impatiens glandulifera]|uniref:E3 ubiquitin-protein ligase SDIR1-like n=1 Tax=Impatiens glandulifera TaxID=253017 RepID=UPI001FB0AC38|nr:E3 ubiquitin-protein ligase SDIR1-like [Impatiens glandulifera]XP_047322879.1 E3 ubiquitin-protein ligase SDIR1-like [Impatiens glandulifera]
MSFVFRGSRADLENGLPEYFPQRRQLRVLRSVRPPKTNMLAFLVTVILLFMILNSNQMPANFLLWLVLGVFFMATSLRMYATCQQLQAQAQAQAIAASGLLGHTELMLHTPPSIALATRGRLHGLRLQLALLEREFDELDYETLRALDSENVPTIPSMSEEEINYLPVHKYKMSSSESGSGGFPFRHGSSSSPSEMMQDISIGVGGTKGMGDELTCIVCLEQVNIGEAVRSLPCLHQFHVSCIDPWLRQQGTCPVCKFEISSGWGDNGQDAIDASHMV